MLDRDFQRKLINKIIGGGGEFADIYIECRRQTSLLIEDSKIEKINTGIEKGIGIRLINDMKTAYAYSNDFSKDALYQAAIQLCKTSNELKGNVILNLDIKNPPIDFKIIKHPYDVPLETKIDLIKKADSIARRVDSRIKQVTVSYRDTIQDVQITTSYGYTVDDKRIYITATIHVISSQDGVIQTAYESIGGFSGFEIFDNNIIEELAFKAARRSIMMLQAKKAPAGRMPVVILSEAGGTMIHEAIGHGLEADLAQQGLSVFTGKKGQQIASRLITVIDDSTLPGKRGSYRFDDEGTPSQRTVLVEDGILKNYMYDRLTAIKDKTLSTGNGRRESYRHRPIPRMSNTFIAQGQSDPESIIKSVKKGLLVVKMGGGQVNTVTGDFVFDVQEGYLIENGQRGEPVRGATLTGNGPDVLKSIDMVGRDFGFSIGTCGKDAQGVPVTDAMPTIRIPEMVVGGTYD